MLKPLLRLDRQGVDRLERESLSLARQLSEVRKSIEMEVGRMPGHFPPEMIRESVARLKQSKSSKIREIESKLLAIAGQVKAQLPLFDENAIRRRAKLSQDSGADALQTPAHVARFERSPDGALLELAQDLASEAVTERSLALARMIGEEVSRRSPEAAQAVGEVLAMVEIPDELGSFSKLLAHVGRETESTALEASELLTGRKAEDRRLELAFAASAN